MNTLKQYVSVSLAVVFASTSVGCGKGFQGSGKSGGVASSNSRGSSTVDVSAQMQKAAEASQQAQAAIADANAAIAQITDGNGNVNLGLFKSASTGSSAQTSTQGLLQPLVDKLNGVFDTLFAKIDMVKQQFASARTMLADALAKLNANDPTQASQIQAINDQLAKIDGLEQNFQNMIHQLAGKLDLATTALDKLISTATSFIPIPGLSLVAGVFVDMFVMSDVKNLIASVKAKLLAV